MNKRIAAFVREAFTPTVAPFPAFFSSHMKKTYPTSGAFGGVKASGRKLRRRFGTR